MFVDRILYPVTALGPGNRIAIWFAGCKRHCQGCANPELWEQNDRQIISVSRLTSMIKHIITQKKVDGITITGGEPFEQVSDLICLLKELRSTKLNVLVFSGFKIIELENNPICKEALKYIDVLIDGNYQKALNDSVAALRGSTNQKIHYLNSTSQKCFEDYLRSGRQIQNFLYGTEILSIGIHSEDTSKE